MGEIFPLPSLLASKGGNDGIVLTSMANRDGEHFLSVMNLDHEAKDLNLTERGMRLFDMRLPGREARLLPVDVNVGPIKLRYSTTEVESIAEDGRSLTFLPTGHEETALIESEAQIHAENAVVEREGAKTLIRIPPGSRARVGV
jgi:beta-galactosidase